MTSWVSSLKSRAVVGSHRFRPPPGGEKPTSFPPSGQMPANSLGYVAPGKAAGEGDYLPSTGVSRGCGSSGWAALTRESPGIYPAPG